MKILICADMEGVCGVVSWLQVTSPESSGGPVNEGEYLRARRRMTNEVSAAVRGAFRGGATEVVVNDFHSGNRNILIDELDDRCRLVSGGAGPLNFMQGIDESFSGAFFTGFHAKAGTVSSALSHTWTTSLNDLRIGGESTGEFGLISYSVGAFGVPVLLVTGDRIACEQTEAFLGRPLAKAVVKEGISQTGAISIHPRRAEELIEERAAEAMSSIGKVEARKLKPATVVEFDFDHQTRADAAIRQTGVRRISERTVAITVDDGLELLRQFVNVMRASSVVLSP